MVRLAVLVAVVLLATGCSNAEQVTVPNLHQKSVVDAYAQLRGLGLKVEIDGAFNLTPNRTSWVEGQAPEAGNDVGRGSVVTLHPGFGAIGMLAMSKAQGRPIVVPPVVGEDLGLAVRMLDDAGLFWDAPDVGPLEPTNADTLYANFEVARAEVEPGRKYDQAARGVRPLPLWLERADD